MERILIIGGAGCVGHFMAGLLADAGHAPIIIDRVAAPSGLDQRVMDALLLPEQAPELLRAATTLIIALPEEAALQVLERYAGAMPALRVLVNTCSVQTPFQLRASRLFCEVPSLGLNPMFSPTLDCRGRPLVLCERGRSEAGEWFEKLLVERGMLVTRLAPDEHDRTMAVCQTLPHAAILAFAVALQHSECDPALIAALAPPPMKTLLSLAARILQNPPETYWDIQKHNHNAARQREQLAKGLDLLHQFCRQDTPEHFSVELDAVRRYLGGGVEHYGQACAGIFTLLNTPQGEALHARSSEPVVRDPRQPHESNGVAGDHAARSAGDYR